MSGYEPRNQIIAQEDAKRIAESYNFVINKVKEYNLRGENRVQHIFMTIGLLPMRVIRKILKLANKNHDIVLYRNEIDEECVEYIKENKDEVKFVTPNCKNIIETIGCNKCPYAIQCGECPYTNHPIEYEVEVA